MFKNKKKTVGIRIPDNNIALELVRELGRPIITTSIHDPDEVIEYTTDPELIYEKYRDFTDTVIDGGFGRNEASTIVDCTGEEIENSKTGIRCPGTISICFCKGKVFSGIESPRAHWLRRARKLGSS